MSYEFSVRSNSEVLPLWADVLDRLGAEYRGVAVLGRADAPIPRSTRIAIGSGYSLANPDPTSIAIVPVRHDRETEVIVSVGAGRLEGEARLAALVAASIGDLTHGMVVLDVDWELFRPHLEAGDYTPGRFLRALGIAPHGASHAA